MWRNKATLLRKKVQVLLCIVAVVHVNCQTCVKEKDIRLRKRVSERDLITDANQSHSKVKLYVLHDSLVCKSKTWHENES